MGRGKDSFALWGEYLQQFDLVMQRAEFVRDRYWLDTLPEHLMLPLKSAIEAAPPARLEEPAENVLPSVADIRQLEGLAKEHGYRDFDEATRAAYALVLEWLKPRIRDVIGSPWRVLTIRSWTTKAGPVGGPNAWHRDGMPKGMMKIMIYFTPVGDEYGGIELGIGQERETIRQVHGPAGTWVLFYNSLLQHRGVAPQREGLERVASEITLAPSHEYDIEPRSLGVNGRHPFAP